VTAAFVAAAAFVVRESSHRRAGILLYTAGLLWPLNSSAGWVVGPLPLIRSLMDGAFWVVLAFSLFLYQHPKLARPERLPRLFQAHVGDLLAELAGTPSLAAVTDSLRMALQDSSLMVFYWIPGRQCYVDEHGRVVDHQGEGTGRMTVPVITSDGRTLAVVSTTATAQATWRHTLPITVEVDWRKPMKPLMRGIATLGATGAIILGLSGQAWAVAVPSGCPILAQGYRGDCVRELQKDLNDPNLAVDGIFGPATERSVKSFQDQHNLSRDGIVGSGTTGALDRANSVDSPRPKPRPVDLPDKAAAKNAVEACKAGFRGGSKDGAKRGAALGEIAGNGAGTLAATETGPAGSKLGGMAGGAAGAVIGGAQGWLSGGAGGCLGQAVRNH
jgi:hypothetical protein